MAILGTPSLKTRDIKMKNSEKEIEKKKLVQPVSKFSRNQAEYENWEVN